jgi:hypothetical protein
MVILRTSLATLLLVAVAGLAYGGQQKGCGDDPGCGKGKEACPKGCGKKDCCGEQACCTTKCDTTKYMGNCYKCVCTPVCLPTRPCCPFKDPACGCDKGKGGDKGGCGHGCNRGCGDCGKGGKDGHEGKTCCSTKGGLLCKLGACGNGCGKGCGDGKGCGNGGGKGCDKGCGDSKGEGACDPCDGKAKSDCGCKGKGLLGGLLPGCCACKSRTKKHLYVKSVVVCEDPKLGCGASGKGCGGGKVDGKNGKAVDEVELDAAPDVPEPPAVPVKIGTFRVPVVTPVSYTSSASLGSMFK